MNQKSHLLLEKSKSALYMLVMSRHFVPVCLLLAFSLRMCWIIFVQAMPVADCKWYYLRALDISAGRGYSFNGHPTAYWPVGYSALLALFFKAFGQSLIVAKLLNVFMYMGILLLSYCMSRKLFRSEFAGRVTLGILSFYPNHIAYCSLTLSEIAFLFFLMLGAVPLVFGVRKYWLLACAGVVFGFTCLIRPLVLLLPILLIKTVHDSGKRRVVLHFGRLAVVYLAMILIMAPWIVRNYRVFHHFVFISNNGGINLLIGNGSEANGTYHFNSRMFSQAGGWSVDEYQRDVNARKLAVNHVLNHPLSLLKLLPKKFLHLYAKDAESFWWNKMGLGTIDGRVEGMFFLLSLIAQLYYIVIGLLFIVALLKFLNNRTRDKRCAALPMTGLWVLVYFTVVHLVYFGDGRYHFPIMPWIIMYVSALVAAWVEPSSTSSTPDNDGAQSVINTQVNQHI